MHSMWHYMIVALYDHDNEKLSLTAKMLKLSVASAGASMSK